jgi:dTDP-4-amino-4,6-dideoxygalactose transaminase
VILPTRLYGQPADLDVLLAITPGHVGCGCWRMARRRMVPQYKERRVGHGDTVTWSFYPSRIWVRLQAMAETVTIMMRCWPETHPDGWMTTLCE